MVDGEAKWKEKSQQLLGIEARSAGLSCQCSDTLFHLLPSNMQSEERDMVILS